MWSVCTSTTRRLPRRTERGSALVLAMLILLAMTGLGLMAMRTSTETIAASGNLRLAKQARYVAETGLYHVMTLMAEEGEAILAMRDSNNSIIDVDSAGAIQVRHMPNPDFDLGPAGNRAPPDFFAAGLPPALGLFGQTTGLVPSYTVRIEGFTIAPTPPEQELGDEDTNGYCLLQFTSRGFIADVALPTVAQFDDVNREQTFAESRIKGAIVLGPFNKSLCQWEMP